MQESLKLSAPTAICLSRQKLPVLEMSAQQEADARLGAWIVKDESSPDIVIYATGSEVSLALSTAKLLPNKKIKVVSMPCWELMLKQPKPWQQKILSSDCTYRVSIEAGSTLGWQKFTGDKGLNIGLDQFGASAPMEALAEAYGFTPEKVAAKIRDFVG
jgi:transketolase